MEAERRDQWLIHLIVEVNDNVYLSLIASKSGCKVDIIHKFEYHFDIIALILLSKILQHDHGMHIIITVFKNFSSCFTHKKDRFLPVLIPKTDLLIINLAYDISGDLSKQVHSQRIQNCYIFTYYFVLIIRDLVLQVLSIRMVMHG